MNAKNVYEQIEEYLAQQLGRQPTDNELNAFLLWLETGGDEQ